MWGAVHIWFSLSLIYRGVITKKSFWSIGLQIIIKLKKKKAYKKRIFCKTKSRKKKKKWMHLSLYLSCILHLKNLSLNFLNYLVSLKSAASGRANYILRCLICPFPLHTSCAVLYSFSYFYFWCERWRNCLLWRQENFTCL